MACLSPQFIVNIIILVAVVAIIRLLIPWLLSIVGAVPPIIMQIINIILWAVIAIAVVYIIFDLLSCLRIR